MAIDLITGHQGVSHISADQIATINNAMMDNFGANKVMRLVGGELTADGLTITISEGYWRVNGFDMEIQEGETLYIDPTTIGLSRIDDIYVEILQDIPTGAQRAEIYIALGEPSATPTAPDEPTAPYLNTDILLQIIKLARVTVSEGAMIMENYSVAYNIQTEVDTIVNVYGAKNLIPFDLEAIKAVNTGGTWSGNTYSYRGIIWTVNDDGTVTANGQLESEYNSSSIFIFSNRMRLNPVFYDKKVILNGCPEGGHASNTYKLYAFRAASSDGSAGTYEDYGNGTESFTWLNKLSSGNISCTIYLHTQVTNLTFKPMLRLASITDDTYEPYAKTNQELTQDTTALLDNTEVNGAVNMLPNNFTTQTINGITWTVNDDGSVTANGTSIADWGIRYSFTPSFSGNYKFTGCPKEGSYSSWWMNLVDVTTSTNYNDLGSGMIIPIIAGHTYSHRLYIHSGKKVSNLTFKPMITVPTYNGDYVPYAKSNRELTDAFTNQVADSDDAYSPSKAYKVGEHCIYNNVIYKCITACSAAAWSVNQNCFEETTLTTAVTKLNSDLSDKQDKIKTVRISGTTNSGGGFAIPLTTIPLNAKIVGFIPVDGTGQANFAINGNQWWVIWHTWDTWQLIINVACTAYVHYIE